MHNYLFYFCTHIFIGIGFGMVIVSFFVCVYYNVIIGWSLYYLFASFQSVLPWTRCDQWWNKLTKCVGGHY